MEINYYKSELIKILKQTDPALIDTDFVQKRADEAAKAYHEAALDGMNPIQADEIANAVLMEGVENTRFSFIVNMALKSSLIREQIPTEREAGVRKVYEVVESMKNVFDAAEEKIDAPLSYDDPLYSELVSEISEKAFNLKK